MDFSFIKTKNLAGDFWGGTAAMLVALPSAIAFGVTVYAPLGSSFAAMGALAGILGVAALGIIAPLVGGTSKLISAPCAPAAAVLSAFAIESMSASVAPQSILVMLTLVSLLAGLLQVTFGTVGLGRLIKYMPYPVVSGYLSGVGLYIIASQTPKFLGAPKGSHFWHSLAEPSVWMWQSMAIGVVTMAAMVLAPKVTKAVPAVIIGLLSGVLAYFCAAIFDPSMLDLNTTKLVIGQIGGGGNFFDSFSARFSSLGGIDVETLLSLLVPALTLAALLSIDTLKTCVVLDAITRSRHDSDRELIGQGSSNVVSALIGGMPGAGTMGATLVNISSGGSTKLSAVMEGVLAVLAYILLGSLIAWVTIASLAGILIVVGFRMIDRHSFGFLKSRSTILDFLVIAAVVTTALTVSLIAASGVGVLLAVLLFIREQINTSIVHRKSYGNETFSKQIRVREQTDILRQKGDCSVIYELQGSLFFGTANQLYTQLQSDLKTKTYITLDMHRVQSVDLTAAHILEQVKDMLGERGGYLIFSRVPQSLPSGQDMQSYFDEVGLAKHSTVKVFTDIDDAIEWVENMILSKEELEQKGETLLNLGDFELFKGRKETTLTDLENEMQKLSFKAGEKIFSGNEIGDQLLFIRRGAVRIVLVLQDGKSYHVSTFGQGNFFGEMSFLDGASRSADAVADTDTDLYSLSRTVFDAFSESHKKTSLQLLEGIASVLAARLRTTNAELRAAEE